MKSFYENNDVRLNSSGFFWYHLVYLEDKLNIQVQISPKNGKLDVDINDWNVCPYREIYNKEGVEICELQDIFDKVCESENVPNVIAPTLEEIFYILTTDFTES